MLLCLVGHFNQHAVDKAVSWWNERGTSIEVTAAGMPGIDCVPVILMPELRHFELRGLTLYDSWFPTVAIARPGDALAIAHELGHVVLGPEHDKRKHHLMSKAHPRWRM